MYFLFRQNNSGGYYTKNDNVSHFVIIEADTADKANEIAEDIGIYFDGCETHGDCPCCGNRWSRVYTEDAMSDFEIAEYVLMLVKEFGHDDRDEYRLHLKSKMLVKVAGYLE